MPDDRSDPHVRGLSEAVRNGYVDPIEWEDILAGGFELVEDDWGDGIPVSRTSGFDEDSYGNVPSAEGNLHSYLQEYDLAQQALARLGGSGEVSSWEYSLTLAQAEALSRLLDGHGIDVSASEEQLTAYAKAGAETGSSKCQWVYAKRLLAGRGVRKDRESANYWLIVLARKGDEDALKLIFPFCRKSVGRMGSVYYSVLPDLVDCMETFQLHLAPCGKAAYRVKWIGSHAPEVYRGLGVPGVLLPFAANDLRSGIRSNPENGPDPSTSRGPAASAMWEKLRSMGLAGYEDSEDTYYVLPSNGS